MAAPVIIAKNQTAGDLGLDNLRAPDRVIPASGQVNLTDTNYLYKILCDSQLRGYIESDDVLLNDGSQDLTKEESLNYVTIRADKTRFGEDYQYVESTSKSTTTSDTPQTKLSMTIPALTGTYRLQWHAVCDMSSTSSSVAARLFDVTADAVIGTIQRKEPKDSNDTLQVGGIAKIDMSGSSKTVRIEYYRIGGSGSAGIQDARIEFWRID